MSPISKIIWNLKTQFCNFQITLMATLDNIYGKCINDDKERLRTNHDGYLYHHTFPSNVTLFS